MPHFDFKDVEDKTKMNSLFFNLKKRQPNTTANSNFVYLPDEISKKEKMLKNFDTQIETERQIMTTVPSILKNNRKEFKNVSFSIQINRSKVNVQ